MIATEYARGRSGSKTALRQRLFAIAYRMTGTRADAEDIETDGSRFLALYNILNPEKLTALNSLMHARPS